MAGRSGKHSSWKTIRTCRSSFLACWPARASRSWSANREQVLAGLRKLPLPDVIILDVMLPDANGFDILQRLKAHPALKAVPVIMLTADAARESVMRGLAGGADGYITKPFERAMLLDGVKAVLGIGA